MQESLGFYDWSSQWEYIESIRFSGNAKLELVVEARRERGLETMQEGSESSIKRERMKLRRSNYGTYWDKLAVSIVSLMWTLWRVKKRKT